MTKKTQNKIKKLFDSKLHESIVLAEFYDFDEYKLVYNKIEEMNLLEIDNMRDLELFKIAVSAYSITLTELLCNGAMCNRDYDKYSYVLDILNYVIGYREAELKGL